MSDFATRKQEVISKISKLVEQANQLYGIKLPNIQLRFDLRGRCAGQAIRRGLQYSMRFNTDMMQNAGWDHLINDTVPHELAHIVCFFRGNDSGHGANWRSTCIALGGNGQRCHSEQVVYAKGKTYAYTTTSGHVTNVSERMHQRIQRGDRYSLKHGRGQLHNQCAFQVISHPSQVQHVPLPASTPAPVVQAVPKVQPKIVPAAQPKQEGGPKKSELVRARIAQAKARGEADTVVVQWAIDVLGMARALAKTYVSNNWAKV